jgi:hypothetical protein
LGSRLRGQLQRVYEEFLGGYVVSVAFPFAVSFTFSVAISHAVT